MGWAKERRVASQEHWKALESKDRDELWETEKRPKAILV